MAGFETSPAQQQVDIRARMLDSLTDYYPTESKNTSFYFLISAYADLVTDADTERAATIEDVGVDESRTDALYPNFGCFYELPKRGDLSWDWYDYRFMLKVLGEAWTLYGSTKWGLRRVVQVATGISPIQLEHYKYAGWILGENALGATAIVQTGLYIWNSVSSVLLNTADILAVWPQQQTNVWLCGVDGGIGQVWFSSGGGSGSVVSMAPPAALEYRAVHGVGPQETWVCGSTAGGGIISHWHFMHGWASTPIAGASFRGVWMLSPSRGWVVGDTGHIRVWNGLNWTAVAPLTANVLFAVHGVSNLAVYAAGANSTVLRWNGVAWSNVSPFPPLTDWRAIHVVNANTVWVCGLSGHVQHTTNAGTTWVGPGVIDPAAHFYGVWASQDGQQVRVVGENIVTGEGVLYYSIDAGVTWGTETIQDGMGFRSIYLRPNDTMGYICGRSGAFLRRNGQSPGFTLIDGTYLANGLLVYGAILESRLGRRNSVDVIVWNILDYNLLVRFLREMKPAHVKLFLVHEVPFVSGYYYYYDHYGSELGAYTFDGDAIKKGIVVNGRPYGTSMSRVVYGEGELYIPQFP